MLDVFFIDILSWKYDFSVDVSLFTSEYEGDG